MRGTVIFLASLALVAGCASSPPARHLEPIGLPQLDARLRAATENAPGVVFGAIWNDGTTVVRAAGAADLRSGRRAEPETPFTWFSLTKAFTAIAVLQLAEQGRMDLDAPVGAYLPEVRLRRDGQEATVRDLLAHTSGLPNPLPVRWVHLASEPGPTLDAMIERRVGAEPRLKSVPGMKYAYSNLGYLLLGEIVERVSGVPYERYVEENVLAPLGCRTSGFEVAGDAATGYQRKWTLTGLASRLIFDGRLLDGTVDGYWALRPLAVDGAPYGGLNGPASCLLALAGATLHGGLGTNGRVLSAQSIQRMLEPSRTRDGRSLGIGLGWHLGRIDGQPVAMHVGGGGGFKAELRLYPERGYAVAVLANETSFDTDPLSRLLITHPSTP